MSEILCLQKEKKIATNMFKSLDKVRFPQSSYERAKLYAHGYMYLTISLFCENLMMR